MLYAQVNLTTIKELKEKCQKRKIFKNRTPVIKILEKIEENINKYGKPKYKNVASDIGITVNAVKQAVKNTKRDYSVSVLVDKKSQK